MLPPEELHLFQIPVKVISLRCQQPPPGLGTAASAMINSSSISPGAAAAFPLQLRGPSPSRSSPSILCSSSQPPRTAPSFLHAIPSPLTAAPFPLPLLQLHAPQNSSFYHCPCSHSSLVHDYPQPHPCMLPSRGPVLLPHSHGPGHQHASPSLTVSAPSCSPHTPWSVPAAAVFSSRTPATVTQGSSPPPA